MTSRSAPSESQVREDLRAFVADVEDFLRYAGQESRDEVGELVARPPQSRVVEAFVFSVLALCGTALLVTVLITGADWFLPFIAFAVATFIAWERYVD